MNAIYEWEEARKWLRYAKEDLETAESLLHDDGFPRHICWLAQQSVEKSLKSIFVFLQISFPRSHDLDALRNLLPEGWAAKMHGMDLSGLTEWAVESRYPGDWPESTQEDAESAVSQAREAFQIAVDDLASRGYPYR